MYLYRAGDSQGNTLEFLLSPTRDAEAAKHFFAKVLAAPNTSTPRVITVDKTPSYPKAYKELKAEGMLPGPCKLRQSKYLNNLDEQDHCFIKRLVKLGIGFYSFEIAIRPCNPGRPAPLVKLEMGFYSFETAWRTLQGHEAINMLRKGQICSVGKEDSMKQVAFIASLFGMAA